MVDFLREFLLQPGVDITDKNKAYNIISYLACRFGKETILGQFQKLNTMILMGM